jgi:hypothetical protein
MRYLHFRKSQRQKLKAHFSEGNTNLKAEKLTEWKSSFVEAKVNIQRKAYKI